MKGLLWIVVKEAAVPLITCIVKEVFSDEDEKTKKRSKTKKRK